MKLIEYRVYCSISLFSNEISNSISHPFCQYYRSFTLGTTRSNSIMATGRRECAWLAILHGFGIRRAPRTYDRPNIPSIPREKHKLPLEVVLYRLHFTLSLHVLLTEKNGRRKRKRKCASNCTYLFSFPYFFFLFYIDYNLFYSFC